jgi:hypothetical protein
VPDTVLPGDLDPGDVIALDGAAEELLVTAVRLGSGGFVLTVAPLRAGRPGPERQLTLTASTPVRKRGRARAWLTSPRTRQTQLHNTRHTDGAAQNRVTRWRMRAAASW